MNRFFNFWTVGLVLATFLGWTGIVRAAGAHAATDKPLKGVVVSVAEDHTSVVINTGHRKNLTAVTVAVDDNTTYTLDGKAAKITDLKAGQKVRISPPTGTAKTIIAKTAKKKGRHAVGSTVSDNSAVGN